MSAGFLALFVLAGVHIFANKAKVLGWVWHGKFLSFASGLSFAYVFVDLLPALGAGQPALKRAFGTFLPYLDKHTYLIALLGVLFFYGIRADRKLNKSVWLPLSGYLLFNFLVGASLTDSANPEIQPLALYVTAIGMHYFVRDHLAQVTFHKPFQIALIAALFSGYFFGYFSQIPDAAAAVAIAFVGGGIILNVLHYELPKKEKGGYLYFLAGSLLYTMLLLTLGDIKG